MHRYLPKHPGVAFHTKLIALWIANDDAAWPALFVLGSHNCSAGAWGRLTPDGAACVGANNVELSVAIRGDDLRAMLEDGSVADELFPYQRPAKPWRSTDRQFTGARATVLAEEPAILMTPAGFALAKSRSIR
jgi:hypothetical protein